MSKENFKRTVKNLFADKATYNKYVEFNHIDNFVRYNDDREFKCEARLRSIYRNEDGEWYLHKNGFELGTLFKFAGEHNTRFEVKALAKSVKSYVDECEQILDNSKSGALHLIDSPQPR